MHDPYFPVPFSPGMLSGSADASYPHLVPRITLADGSVLMPLAFFKDVRVTRRGAVTQVSWRQDALDLMGQNDARPDRRASIETRYTFAPGRITRSDQLRLAPGVRAAKLDIEFSSFSSGARQQAGATRFADGEVRSFAAQGYGGCSAGKPDSPVYRAPTGPLATVVRCERSLEAPEQVVRLSWSIRYD